MIEGMIDILMVEDSPEDEELALHALRQRKLANHIVVVHDGEEALDFIFRTGPFANRTNSQPKMILLDLKLPKIDGLEVLRRIKEDETARLIPVVVMTSSREDRDLTVAYRLGVNSYIVKPVDFEQFTQCVQQLGFYWLLLNQPPAL